MRLKVELYIKKMALILEALPPTGNRTRDRQRSRQIILKMCESA